MNPFNFTDMHVHLHTRNYHILEKSMLADSLLNCSDVDSTSNSCDSCVDTADYRGCVSLIRPY